MAGGALCAVERTQSAHVAQKESIMQESTPASSATLHIANAVGRIDTWDKSPVWVAVCAVGACVSGIRNAEFSSREDREEYQNQYRDEMVKHLSHLVMRLEEENPDFRKRAHVAQKEGVS